MGNDRTPERSELTPEEHVDSMIQQLNQLKDSIDNDAESISADDERVQVLRDMAAERQELIGVSREKLEELQKLIEAVPEDILGRENVEFMTSRIVAELQEETHSATNDLLGADILKGTPLAGIATEGGFLSRFNVSGITGTLKHWRNKLAFSMGGAIKEIEKSGFFSKNMLFSIASWFIGKERMQFAEAMKLHQFKGLEEAEGYSLNNIVAIHKQKFGNIPLDSFFFTVARKARESHSSAVALNFKQLTIIANSVDAADITNAQPEESATEEVVDKQSGPVDVLNAYAPEKVAGMNFRVIGDKAVLEGGENFQLTHPQLHELQITKATLVEDGTLDITVTATEGTFSGTVDAEKLKRIVSGYPARKDTVDVSQGVAGYQLVLEEYSSS